MAPLYGHGLNNEPLLGTFYYSKSYNFPLNIYLNQGTGGPA
jgi:hypothetical protein